MGGWYALRPLVPLPASSTGLIVGALVGVIVYYTGRTMKDLWIFFTIVAFVLVFVGESRPRGFCHMCALRVPTPACSKPINTCLVLAGAGQISYGVQEFNEAGTFGTVSDACTLVHTAICGGRCTGDAAAFMC